MEKRVPEFPEDRKEEQCTSSMVMYSADDVDQIKKEYDAKLSALESRINVMDKLAALESKIQVIETAVLPKSPAGRHSHAQRPCPIDTSIESATPRQLLELFGSSLKKGPKKPDFRTLTVAWGVLFSSLFLSTMEVQSEIHSKISPENQTMLREVVKADCARGGRFVFNVIKNGGHIDRSALIMIADLQDLAGIKQDGVPAIHLLTRACDKNIRPCLIERAGKQLLSRVFDRDGLPVFFIILGLANISIFDIEAIERAFSKDDLREIMVQNRTGRNGLEAFTEIATRMREHLDLQHKRFAAGRPEAPATRAGVCEPPENIPITDENGKCMPVDKKTGCQEETADDSKSVVDQKDVSSLTASRDTRNKNIKILIVDDIEIIRDLLLQQLNDLGYENCILAKSGDEAVKIAAEARPYLVFMDITMPGKLDGIAAAREIKKHSDTRIVFLTGGCNKDTLDQARELDPEGYILKPFSETKLRVALKLLK
jgi:CheY-like chemotaxis protein